jgi:hypothetical protein
MFSASYAKCRHTPQAICIKEFNHLKRWLLWRINYGEQKAWDNTQGLLNNTTKYSNYIQQDATLHSLFYPETALHVSGGTITRHKERIQLYLQHLVFVTPLLLPAAIVKELELV